MSVICGRAQGILSTVSLYDPTGVTLVTTIPYPAFSARPNAIIWQDRFFAWNGTLTKWVEGWAWFV